MGEKGHRLYAAAPSPPWRSRSLSLFPLPAACTASTVRAVNAIALAPVKRRTRHHAALRSNTAALPRALPCITLYISIPTELRERSDKKHGSGGASKTARTQARHERKSA